MDGTTLRTICDHAFLSFFTDVFSLMEREYFLLFYLVFINALSFVVFGIDKWKARHNCWRISEFWLLTCAAVGGALGAWIGMQVWHHKTMHAKFRYGVPLLLLAQFVAAICLIEHYA